MTIKQLDELHDHIAKFTEATEHLICDLQDQGVVTVGREFTVDPYACKVCGQDLDAHYRGCGQPHGKFVRPDLSDIRDGHVPCGECGHTEGEHDTDDYDPQPTACGSGGHSKDGEWIACGCQGFRLRLRSDRPPDGFMCVHGFTCAHCAIDVAVNQITSTGWHDGEALSPGQRAVMDACAAYMEEQR